MFPPHLKGVPIYDMLILKLFAIIFISIGIIFLIAGIFKHDGND